MKLLATLRQFEGPDDLERRHDLSQVAVIAVVLVADDHQIRRFVDRQVAARVGRAIRVKDDPQTLGFDQERGVSVPGDAHRWVFLSAGQGSDVGCSCIVYLGHCREIASPSGRLIDSKGRSADDNLRAGRPHRGRHRLRGAIIAFGITGHPFREIDLEPLWRALRVMREHPDWDIIGFGVFLRILAYSYNRPYWMDEGSLLGNLVETRVFDFSGPLHGDQLAPIGFMIIQRMIIGVLGSSGYATRLLPLICGIAALWLVRKLAFRWLSAPAAMAALVMFAVSDDLVYYSSEVKPYSSDLLYGLAILLASSSLLDHPLCARRLAVLGVLAAAGPWLSFPSVFMIAGCGAVLIAVKAKERKARDVIWLAAVASAWAVSFFLSYRASQALLHPATTMYVFWNFAFVPFPFQSAADLMTTGGIILEVFVNPLYLVPWSLPVYMVALPIVLWLVGAFRLGRRHPAFFGFLIVPMVLAFCAAAARKYPFHGRLLIELVPAFYFVIAEGADGLRLKFGRTVFLAVLILMLTYPSLSAVWESTGVRYRDFNIHGDLHRNRFME